MKIHAIVISIIPVLLGSSLQTRERTKYRRNEYNDTASTPRTSRLMEHKEVNTNIGSKNKENSFYSDSNREGKENLDVSNSDPAPYLIEQNSHRYSTDTYASTYKNRQQSSHLQGTAENSNAASSYGLKPHFTSSGNVAYCLNCYTPCHLASQIIFAPFSSVPEELHHRPDFTQQKSFPLPATDYRGELVSHIDNNYVDRAAISGLIMGHRYVDTDYYAKRNALFASEIERRQTRNPIGAVYYHGINPFQVQYST